MKPEGKKTGVYIMNKVLFTNNFFYVQPGTVFLSSIARQELQRYPKVYAQAIQGISECDMRDVDRH